MSNECQRVIILHAPTEIRKILQIEENISIINIRRKGHDCCRGRCTFPSRTAISREVHTSTNPSILDEKQLHLKQDRLRSHKSVI